MIARLCRLVVLVSVGVCCLAGCNAANPAWAALDASSLPAAEKAVVYVHGTPAWGIGVFSVDGVRLRQQAGMRDLNLRPGDHTIRVWISETNVVNGKTPAYHKTVAFTARAGCEYLLNLIVSGDMPLVGWTDTDWWSVRITEVGTSQVWHSGKETLSMPLF